MAAVPKAESIPADWSSLPSNLPVPTDDREADHLRAGATSQVELPAPILLRATRREEQGCMNGKEDEEIVVDLKALSFDKPVLVFVYPKTGVPGVPNLPGWDAIPGARGCTPELCGVRDSLGTLQAARPSGIHIFALSTQSPAYQAEVARRLDLPYPILSDERRVFLDALGLPTFEVEGMVLLKRITVLIYEGKVIGRDYPVFPPDQAASRALELLCLLDV